MVASSSVLPDSLDWTQDLRCFEWSRDWMTSHTMTPPTPTNRSDLSISPLLHTYSVKNICGRAIYILRGKQYYEPYMPDFSHVFLVRLLSVGWHNTVLCVRCTRVGRWLTRWWKGGCMDIHFQRPFLSSSLIPSSMEPWVFSLSLSVVAYLPTLSAPIVFCLGHYTLTSDSFSLRNFPPGKGKLLHTVSLCWVSILAT